MDFSPNPFTAEEGLREKSMMVEKEPIGDNDLKR